MLCLYFSLQLAIPCVVLSSVTARDTEYDSSVIDPDGAFGSPYGGFSRSSANRLASLALRLPNIQEDATEILPVNIDVRTTTGASLSCRTYSRDEIDYKSMQASMFEKPTHLEAPESEAALSHLGEEAHGPNNKQPLDDSSRVDFEFLNQRLETLLGLCAQIHQGWWSYEWCYGEKVTQFHVDVKNVAAGEQSVTVQDLTILGEFSGRQEVISDGAEDNEIKPMMVDSFVGGDTCSETGQPRETEVVYSCCNTKVLGRNSGGVLFDGRQLATNIISIQGVTESDDAVCTYKMTVCTPLVCTEHASSGSSDSSVTDMIHLKDMTVSDVLKSTFRNEKEGCIHFASGGWWTYELCPGEYIRQYHEKTILDRATGTATKQIDSEHMLGKYDVNTYGNVSGEKEWDMMQNVTALNPTGVSKSTAALKPNQGNGAFYVQEYIGGDICDEVDVTGAAIKAGEVGEGNIGRATTVKYGCGSQVEMIVKEDSTCHYVATVWLPTLCHHPLFMTTTSTAQVVKCS